LPSSSKLGFKYCTGCGAPLEDVVRLRFCPYCGNKDEGKKFCSECGASLLDLPTTVQDQPDTTTQVAASAQPAIMAQPAMASTDASQAGATTARLAKAYCPDCGNEATWISQYNQWYCYVDQKYVTQPSYTEPKKGLFKKK